MTEWSTAARRAFGIEIEVDAHDIDEQGHVSNVRVVHWMTQSTLAHSAAEGWDPPAFEDVGGFFVLRRWEIDYVNGAYDGDQLEILTWPTKIGGRRAERAHLIVRGRDQRVIARAVSSWTYVSIASRRPTPIPSGLLAAFEPTKFS